MPFKVIPPLYHVWRSMRDRCTNPHFKQWKDYGGRGIRVCKRWDSYALFVADMGPRPNGYLLDRINNDKGYSPSNCRWATRSQQQLNQRVTRKVVIGRKEYIAAKLAKIAGIKTDAIIERVAAGLPFSKVIDSKRRGKPLQLVCKRGHPFDKANTYHFGNLRQCRKCHAMRQRLRSL